MADFTLNYKKYYPSSERHNENVAVEFNNIPPTVSNVPNWLTVTVANVSNGIYTYLFKVKPSGADVLSPGFHEHTVKIQTYLSNGGNYEVFFFDVGINIIDTVLLELNPTQMGFVYKIGGTIPPTQNLNIKSENNWSLSKTESWITVSNTNGINEGNIDVGVDITGLPVGTYTGTVLVDDGLFQRTLTVNLIVSAEITPTDYLTVTPQTLEFLETINVPSNQTRAVEIDASESWTATKNATWLNVDTLSGDAGPSTLTLSVTQASMPLGIYYAAIEIQTATIVQTVNVVLRISEVATNGIQDGELYFAKDRNYLTVTNTAANTFAHLDFSATTPIETVNYPFRAVYFKGISSILIGLETENLLLTKTISSVFTTRVFSPITPLSYAFKVFDTVLFNNSKTLKQAFSNVRFLNGKTPQTPNRLTYLPQAITTTNDAIIALTFLSTTSIESIEITGDITQSISVSATQDTVQTALLNLNDLALTPGQTITATVGGQAVQITIKPAQPEHTLLAFENEWQCPEYFMLTGALKITSNKGWLTTTVDNNGDAHQKILEAKNALSFQVNTGHIYSQDEIDWLDKMFECETFYLFIKGVKTEVIPTFNKLVPYETRRNSVSFNLTFKKAIV